MMTCVIVNPNAGSTDSVDRLRKDLEQLGTCYVFESREPGDGTGLARDAVARGCRRIVAAGGDGTINEVVQGLAPHFQDVEFGLIPMGTGNDFARSVGVPADVTQAVALLLAGRVRPLDVVRVTAEDVYYYVNTSGAGYVPLVDTQVSSQTKGWWGSIAYLWGGLKAVPQVPEYKATVVLDKRDRIETSMYNVMVCNGRYIGGGIPIAPRALLDDGLLDVLIAPVMPLTRLAAVATSLLQGEHQDMEDLIFRRAQRVRIESDPPMLFNIDGEGLGESPVEYEVLPRALRVVVGEQPEAVDPAAGGEQPAAP